MSYPVLSNLLQSLEYLYTAISQTSTSRSRQYVRQEHAPFLSTRFRIFDEYLVSRRPRGFLDFIGIMPDGFEKLYEKVAPTLEHQRTHAGPISGRHRLMIYLRYVMQGISFPPYALDIGMGKSTVSAIVEEVTKAIIFELHKAAFPRLRRARLKQVANRTQARFDYPRAVGFMDGKHIHIKKPAHSGSTYWNYQHYNSIILLAICDCDYRLMAYDIGAPGRAGDAGSAPRLSRELGSVGPVRYHILVNGGFGQSHRFIRPFRKSEANTSSKRRFNQQLSGARNMTDFTFGLLAQRFQVLMYRINLDPVRVARLVVSLMILHNLLPRREDSLEGIERYGPAPSAYHSLEREEPEAGPALANLARKRLAQYFGIRYGMEQD